MTRAGYVDDGFYRGLAAEFTDWRREDRRIGDPALLESCRGMLHLEARLLDEGRFEDWLALFAARVPVLGTWLTRRRSQARDRSGVR